MNITERRLKDGRLAWRLEWRAGKEPGTGKVRRIYETFHGTKREAKQYWRDKQAEIDKSGSGFVVPTKATLDDYAREWLRGLPVRGRRPSTVASYERSLKSHVLPALGAMPLRDLTPVLIRRWLADMREGGGAEGHPVGATTTAYARRVLGLVLKAAERDGLVTSNPVAKTEAPAATGETRDAFTMEEAEAILRRSQRSRLGPLFEFAWLSGLRRGEVLGLRWGAVDMDRGLCVIRRSRTVVRGKGVDQEDTKTKAGHRMVSLPERAVDALRRAWRVQARDKLQFGPAYHDEGLVFATRKGMPYHPEAVSDEFRRFRDAAIIPAGGEGEAERRVRRLPFHSLRHSAASMLIAAGVPAEVGAKQLGHRRVSTFTDLYGHLMAEASEEAARRMDAFLRDNDRTKGATGRR